MSDCSSVWTPGNTFGFVLGLYFLFYMTGLLDLLEELVRKR